jgi:hypothetical protein
MMARVAGPVTMKNISRITVKRPLLETLRISIIELPLPLSALIVMGDIAL